MHIHLARYPLLHAVVRTDMSSSVETTSECHRQPLRLDTDDKYESVVEAWRPQSITSHFLLRRLAGAYS
jgi:hypothetical protein